MNDPLAWIDDEAGERQTRGLTRRVVARDPHLINFASNDYLGLANNPRVIEAASEAARRFGFGAGASPLVSGWTEAHEALAADLADFEGVEAVALFPTGYAANLGTIAALVDKGDAVYVDRLNHACLIEGARLSGATLRVYPHNSADRLASLMANDRHRFRRLLVVTDGVFSMDGDLAPLDQIASACEQFGAILMVDDAHGTGVFGATGRGACEHFGVGDRVPVRVGTLSKALGSLGGFVAGSRRLVDHLTNHAKTMIYSTATPPACAAAAREALRIARDEPWRREKVHRLGDAMRTRLRAAGWAVPESSLGPIVPVIVGDPSRAVERAAKLREQGFLVPAIRPPTVPEGTSRLRIGVTAAHDEAHVAAFSDAIGSP
jgi:8-amino-7-oxononanoate synthase